jgi:hypothetical protein
LPTYRYRRLTAVLPRERRAVNGKRVRCLVAEIGVNRRALYARSCEPAAAMTSCAFSTWSRAWR